MVLLSVTKLDLLPGLLLKNMGLIIQKHFPLLLVVLQFAASLPLMLLTIKVFVTWMSRMFFSMVISLRKFICNILLVPQFHPPNAHDSALFIRKKKCGILLLLLYVDDMIITRDDIMDISSLKQFLSRQFEMKDSSLLSYFLSLEISSNPSSYFLTQAKYTSNLLARASLTDCIVYVVHIVSQFMVAPCSPHYDALVHILCYLKDTMFYGLHYSAHYSLQLHAFSDADWARDPTDRHYTTRFCFFLSDSLIAWHSNKKTFIARSSTEVEYCALIDTSQELVWLCWLLSDIGISHPTATILYCDNQSAIQITHSDVFHDRTKRVEKGPALFLDIGKISTNRGFS
ncbi:uncharacterized protein LOC114301482 [Camellia sinensis]|uniref:uncharacterized protein LOC114301482 n=1 Tax=Camellia sinensis TaxID=4442 RepID=UPI001036C4F5|nr:uncharacterized protein LOC114301482 [Camellia sinensis]